MPKKTNKTSHVLNLITNGGSAEAEETMTEADQEESGDKKIPQEESAVKTAPPVEVAVKEQIPPVEPAVKEQIPRPAADKSVLVIDETSQNDKLSSQILDSLTSQAEMEIKKNDSYHMVNVMEQIIKGMNLRKYMEQNEVCPCSRCQADVFALVLTRLPAKYVVVDECPTAPIISFYESKFRIRIITEIIKACNEVKEKPRHGRLGPFIP